MRILYESTSHQLTYAEFTKEIITEAIELYRVDCEQFAINKYLEKQTLNLKTPTTNQVLALVNQLAPRVNEVDLLKKNIAPIFMKFQSEGKITAIDFTKICRGMR